jgi:hypothetical protein
LSDDEEKELAEFLHAHSQAGYDREIEANESIWRTLPLFAVLFGFAGTLLSFIATRAPEPDKGAWAYATYVLLLATTFVFGVALRFMWDVMKPRLHRYLPDDMKVREHASALTKFYLESGLSDGEAQRATRRDIHSYITEEFAAASAENQKHNQAKTYARGQTLFYLFVGFILSIVTSATILLESRMRPGAANLGFNHVTNSFATPIPAGTGSGTARGSPETFTTSTAIYRGRRGPAVSPEQGRAWPEAPVSKPPEKAKAATPAPTANPAPKRPERPAPTMVLGSVKGKSKQGER